MWLLTIQCVCLCVSPSVYAHACTQKHANSPSESAWRCRMIEQHIHILLEPFSRRRSLSSSSLSPLATRKCLLPDWLSIYRIYPFIEHVLWGETEGTFQLHSKHPSTLDVDVVLPHHSPDRNWGISHATELCWLGEEWCKKMLLHSYLSQWGWSSCDYPKHCNFLLVFELIKREHLVYIVKSIGNEWRHVLSFHEHHFQILLL